MQTFSRAQHACLVTQWIKTNPTSHTLDQHKILKQASANDEIRSTARTQPFKNDTKDSAVRCNFE